MYWVTHGEDGRERTERDGNECLTAGLLRRRSFGNQRLRDEPKECLRRRPGDSRPGDSRHVEQFSTRTHG